jgi:methionyl-tRNA formyltransferase
MNTKPAMNDISLYPRIIFMGTPDFAVPSLDILHKNGFPVVAVVTSPDKPAGRGLKMQASAVKKYALAHDIPVLQPVKLKDPAFLAQLRSLKADIQVVVAFRMLPEAVWNMPPLGTINLHASLLPQYRGAAPINWAIINGEKETGITTFKLKHEIDTGEIIYQRKITIREDETAGELHDEMMELGARLLLQTIQSISKNDYPLTSQAMDNASLPIKQAPKIHREDCKIPWNKSVEEIYNLIRGLSPYPAAWTVIDGKILKIFRSKKSTEGHAFIPGTTDTDQHTYLRIAGNNGWIYLTEVQLAGKKRMDIEEFLRGYRGKEMIIS